MTDDSETDESKKWKQQYGQNTAWLQCIWILENSPLSLSPLRRFHTEKVPSAFFTNKTYAEERWQLSLSLYIVLLSPNWIREISHAIIGWENSNLGQQKIQQWAWRKQEPPYFLQNYIIHEDNAECFYLWH